MREKFVTEKIPRWAMEFIFITGILVALSLLILTSIDPVTQHIYKNSLTISGWFAGFTGCTVAAFSALAMRDESNNRQVFIFAVIIFFVSLTVTFFAAQTIINLYYANSVLVNSILSVFVPFWLWLAIYLWRFGRHLPWNGRMASSST